MRVRKSLLILVVALGLAALLPDSAEAGRRWRQRHARRARFVVIVGQPRPLVHAVVLAGRPAGAIDFHVKPEETSVFVDGEYRGTVDQYDGQPEKLLLVPGSHRITLKTPEGETWSEKVRVTAGHEVELKVALSD